MMTCKYNIPLKINSNWFLKIYLGKQCFITQTSNEYFRRNFRKVYHKPKSKLLSCPSKVWTTGLKLFFLGLSRTMTFVLSTRLASTCWKSSFKKKKTVTLARNISSICLTKENRQSLLSGLQLFVSKTWLKSKLNVFPF